MSEPGTRGRVFRVAPRGFSTSTGRGRVTSAFSSAYPRGASDIMTASVTDAMSLVRMATSTTQLAATRGPLDWPGGSDGAAERLVDAARIETDHDLSLHVEDGDRPAAEAIFGKLLVH